MIPFAGPSNLFIASNIALMLGDPDPSILVTVGLLVALGAALGKERTLSHHLLRQQTSE